MYKIGVIGCGHRMTPLVKRLLENDDFTISAICDPKAKDIKSEFEGYDITCYNYADKMLETEVLDCIMIGTRCSLHTELMVKVAKYGYPTFLEKPVSINWEQLKRLEPLTDISDKVVVSFPLRNTSIVNTVRDIVKSGKIGDVAQIQAYNNVNYGRGYYHGWYRDESETGGLWLQKATHDFDYINSLVQSRPVQITAMESKQVFYGDMPAGLTCDKCDRRRDCPESDVNIKAQGDKVRANYCCFAKDTGNHDSATAIIMYENGMHAVYTQNFIARKGAGRRGARLIGHKGTVEFDFYSGTITVFYHFSDHVEHHTIPKTSGHSGSDAALIANFANVVRGRERSSAPLADGILSARMCLLAKDSSQNRKFYNI